MAETVELIINAPKEHVNHNSPPILERRKLGPLSTSDTVAALDLSSNKLIFSPSVAKNAGIATGYGSLQNLPIVQKQFRKNLPHLSPPHTAITGPDTNPLLNNPSPPKPPVQPLNSTSPEKNQLKSLNNGNPSRRTLNPIHVPDNYNTGLQRKPVGMRNPLDGIRQPKLQGLQSSMSESSIGHYTSSNHLEPLNDDRFSFDFQLEPSESDLEFRGEGEKDVPSLDLFRVRVANELPDIHYHGLELSDSKDKFHIAESPDMESNKNGSVEAKPPIAAQVELDSPDKEDHMPSLGIQSRQPDGKKKPPPARIEEIPKLPAKAPPILEGIKREESRLAKLPSEDFKKQKQHSLRKKSLRRDAEPLDEVSLRSMSDANYEDFEDDEISGGGLESQPDLN